MSKSEISLLN